MPSKHILMMVAILAVGYILGAKFPSLAMKIPGLGK